ncbi:hypothetical protein BT69DRAFT_1315598 [Atractiella rhizophila]|nr:hypothetical protein BT69DRAFT_1315598 [Atractiella rhizophila]
MAASGTKPSRVVINPLSRNQACQNCKQRKIRCGGQRPICESCVKFATARGEDPANYCFYLSEPKPKAGEKKRTSSAEEKAIKQAVPITGNRLAARASPQSTPSPTEDHYVYPTYSQTGYAPNNTYQSSGSNYSSSPLSSDGLTYHPYYQPATYATPTSHQFNPSSYPLHPMDYAQYTTEEVRNYYADSDPAWSASSRDQQNQRR